MTWRRGRDGVSWLPVERILWAPTNAAHYNHLHVVGSPRKTGTPPLRNPGVSHSLRTIMDALNEYFPGYTNLGIYNRRKISGSTTWSQHSWSNAIDIGVYNGVAEQQVFYDMLTSPTKPGEGGDDMPTSEEIAQAIWSFPVPQVGDGVTTQLALARATNLAQATFNLLTVDENTVNDAELDAAVSSLLDSLPDAVVAKIANKLAPGPA